MRSVSTIFAVCSVPLAILAPITAEASPMATAADSGAGSTPVGSTSYAIPERAVFVAPWGDDSASGRADNPVRTVTRALRSTPWGGTIVVRGGTYHESVVMPHEHPVTIQSYPGEAVWFDGARRVGGWTRDGDAWRVDGWTAELDNSPSYFRGRAEHSGENMQFVNSASPMAASPDQVWINGTELRQVASRDVVTQGTFYVDRANDKLYVGSDPSGRRVEASDLGRAFTIQSAGTTLRGIGVRRYAPSVPDQGAINSYWPRVTLENVVVADSSTAGLGLYGADSTVRQVTISDSGQLGIGATHADSLTLDRIAVTGSNKEHFNKAPVAGGIKITASRDVTLKDSLIADNDGTGFWIDESVYNAVAVNNTIRNNSGRGIYYELSEKGLIEGNTITDSAEYGISIYNTGNVKVRNNYIMSKGEALSIFQDGRRPGDPGMPGDARWSNPEMTWQVRNLDIQNNTLGGDKSSVSPATALVRVYGKGRLDLRAGSSQNIVLDNNTYTWSGERPKALLWFSISESGDRFSEYSDLNPLRAELGQERSGRVGR